MVGVGATVVEVGAAAAGVGRVVGVGEGVVDGVGATCALGGGAAAGATGVLIGDGEAVSAADAPAGRISTHPGSIQCASVSTPPSGCGRP